MPPKKKKEDNTPSDREKEDGGKVSGKNKGLAGKKSQRRLVLLVRGRHLQSC